MIYFTDKQINLPHNIDIKYTVCKYYIQCLYSISYIPMVFRCNKVWGESFVNMPYIAWYFQSLQNSSLFLRHIHMHM